MRSSRKNKLRSLLIGFIFFLCLTCVFGRLFWIQVISSKTLTAQASEQWEYHRILKAKRGTIYDRTRTQAFAWEVDAYVYVAEPRIIKNPKRTAMLLSPVLDIPQAEILKKLTENRASVEIKGNGKYKFTQETHKKVLELIKKENIVGISPFPTRQRQYKENEATHILGFLNADSEPVGGVESFYNNELKGKDGEIKYTQAKGGIMISDQPQKYMKPVAGKDLVLTLDSRIQQQVEKLLDESVISTHAKGGTAIVADPKTGEILAMASRPTFNPNQFHQTYTPERAKNIAVESQFEPGSTFKIVTLAAAIEEGVFQENATFPSGSIQVGNRLIRDWKSGGWGAITYRQGVELSSNVAFVKIAQVLGAEKLIQYIDRFGFGDITKRLGEGTGIDLPNEAKGYYFKRPIGPIELATTSFGQGISVTPIQQLAAVCAIANGGKWIQPHVVKEIWDTDSKKLMKTFQMKGEQIVSPQTASKVADLLRGVVTKGTGQAAEIPEFPVAGKTGTAQKPNPDGGGYFSNKYIISFVGFAPYQNPNIVVFVAIDEPTSGTGSSTSAPLAREILKKALQIRHVQSTTLGK